MRVGALITVCLALAGAARAEDLSAWQRAYDPATRTAFYTSDNNANYRDVMALDTATGATRILFKDCFRNAQSVRSRLPWKLGPHVS